MLRLSLIKFRKPLSLRSFTTSKATPQRPFKLKKDPESERQVFQEMSINIDLYNDRLPTNEELAGRKSEHLDKYATDRTMTLDLNWNSK